MKRNTKTEPAVISQAQADQIESYLGTFITVGGLAGSATRYLKAVGVPTKIAKHAIDLASEVRDAIDDVLMVTGDADRCLFEDVVNYYESLDNFLNRSFHVTDKRTRGRYKFRVGE